ncbi:hypothetical protein KY363_04035 [Candidatus Woesearchaeota archaeon]|nr:hypothetical protein [Candidatus Woesearchaeota archaeon]
MDLTILYLQNSPLIEIVYAILIVILTAATYRIVQNLYTLSGHRGIKHFGLAFLLFSIAFTVQLIMYLLSYLNIAPHPFLMNIVFILFAYILTLSAFHLVYSLVWKQVETGSRFMVRLKMLVLYLVPLLTAGLGVLLFQNNKHFLFIPPIAVIGYGLFLSYQNYTNATPKTRRIRQLFFIVMALWLLGWVMNYVNSIVITFYPLFPLYTDALTLGVFCICLYGVYKLTRK